MSPWHLVLKQGIILHAAGEVLHSKGPVKVNASQLLVLLSTIRARFSTLSLKDCLLFTRQINQTGRLYQMSSHLGFRAFPPETCLTHREGTSRNFICKSWMWLWSVQWVENCIYWGCWYVCPRCHSTPSVFVVTHQWGSKSQPFIFLEICTVYINIHVYIKQSTFWYRFEFFSFYFFLICKRIIPPVATTVRLSKQIYEKVIETYICAILQFLYYIW